MIAVRMKKIDFSSMGNGNYSGRIIRRIRRMGQREVGGQKKLKEKKNEK
jgi:hypothetical protein